MDSAKIMLLCKLVAKEPLKRSLPPAISPEEHSSYCSGRHSPAPKPRRR